MILDLATPYGIVWHREKEMIIGKVISEISRKNDVHNNYETDYKVIPLSDTNGND